MNTIQLISAECDRIGIAFDSNQVMNEVSPGCFLFYGTELTQDCRKNGYCRVRSYYAVLKDNTVTIRKRG